MLGPSFLSICQAGFLPGAESESVAGHDECAGDARPGIPARIRLHVIRALVDHEGSSSVFEDRVLAVHAGQREADLTCEAAILSKAVVVLGTVSHVRSVVVTVANIS